MIENVENVIELQIDKKEDEANDNIYCTEEIVIEEMAIDGICGVY